MSPASVLFFTCHDLGQHLGCYGQPTVTSPALDQLAASGVRFARGFCTAPQCSPSRASLHTGRYPHSTGVLGLAHAPYGWRLDPRERHVAQLLAAAGYSTTLVGMQHLIERGSAYELGYERVLPVAPAFDEADAAISLLGELSAADQPFYLEVGFEEPHRPYDFGGALPDTSRGVAVPAYLPDVPEAREDFAAFQGSIRQMDTAVGRILHALDDLDLTEQTCVIFATDHGAAMPRAKCTLYDPGIEIALLWRWPSAGIAGGAVISDLVSNVDVTPSLLEGLGLPPPPNLHGRSFWNKIAASPTTSAYVPRDEIFAEKTFHTYYEPMRAIRTAHHKLIVNFEVSTRVDVPSDIRESPIYPLMLRQLDDVRPPVELYDLQADQWEQRNLADAPHVAALQTDLRQRLLGWMAETDDPLLRGPVASPYYADALARLRAD
ncbi:MAG TPA: sulfatase [Chloroflexota bacterium]|nr:sulfatase [Chloroflexota bacterium]